MNNMQNGSQEDMQERRVYPFFFSRVFWLPWILLIADYWVGKIIPFVTILFLPLILFLFIGTVWEAFEVLKDMDAAGIPRGRQISVLQVVSCWIMFVVLADMSQIISVPAAVAAILFLISFKDIPKYSLYLWVRRTFVSTLFGFVFPLGILLVIMNIARILKGE